MINIVGDLYYRRLEREDLKKRVEWVNDPEINYTLTFDTPVSLASTEAWFQKVLLDSSKINFMFFIKEDGGYRPIGFGGFINIDRINNRAELFITIGDKKQQGKGLGKKIVDFLVGFGFGSLVLHKIYLTTLAHNEKAIYIYKKCGFEVEGMLRHHVMHQGELKSLYFMSKFKEVK